MLVEEMGDEWVKVGVDKRHNPQPLVKRGSKKK